MAARAAAGGNGRWLRFAVGGVLVGGAGFALSADKKQRRRALAVCEAGFAPPSATCSLCAQYSDQYIFGGAASTQGLDRINQVFELLDLLEHAP